MSSSPRLGALLSLITLFCLLILLSDRLVEIVLLQNISDWLYRSMIVLGAVALVLGILNVVAVHVRRIRAGDKEWSFSLVLILCLIGTWVTGLAAPNGIFNPIVAWIFERLVMPGQAALFALLPFFLAVAAWRYLRFDQKGGTWMLAGALLMLFMQMPGRSDSLLSGLAPFYEKWLSDPVIAVMRGVLLGGALAAVAAALRLMVGRG
ncbi:MAG: hypothetical protein U0175_33245 [Caldilineaceae bacterium]